MTQNVGSSQRVYTSPKTTAAQNEVALSYHSMRGLYFLAVVFVRSIVIMTSLSYLITNKGTRITEPL